MNKFILAVLMVIGFSVGVAPAIAATATGEVRFSDVQNNAGDGVSSGATEYRAQFDDTINSLIYYGVEITTTQVDGNGFRAGGQTVVNRGKRDVSSKLVGKLGVSLPNLSGLTTKLYGEAGEVFSTGVSDHVIGAGVQVSYPLYRNLSALGGYRYRRTYVISDSVSENRWDIGVALNATKALSVGAKYYFTSVTNKNVNTLGLFVSYRL